ncbi:hypothetical protein HMN09_00141000 [Mycena chlorophos]|uniref:Nephrocystin 3-like N-terminal domain-containing protein n=1 Tax=Mycena chlorophos TaxID=658473 RepID=A0A8H6TKD8_MYCCL|nr:hypothetical protein HMN09_00141000 [Mycena chlorophos]
MAVSAPQFPSQIAEPWAAEGVNARIDHSAFTAVYETRVLIDSRAAVEALRRHHVVRQAVHDSRELSCLPRCHPGTRKNAFDELRAWASDEAGDEAPILWLNSSNGWGKTTLLLSVADECSQLGWLGASFFFKKDDKRRGSAAGLASTLAWSLAQHWPEYCEALELVLRSDQSILGRSVQAEFLALLGKPTSSLRPPQGIGSFIFIIDGLDECNPQDKHNVAQAVLQLVTAYPDLPIRFILSSVEDFDLKTILQSPQAQNNVCSFEQDNSTWPQNYEDIRRFLTDSAQRIRSAFLPHIVLSDEWMSSDQIDQITSRCAGLFLPAATAIAYLETARGHPQDHLPAVLAMDAHSTHLLDSFYFGLMNTEFPASHPQDSAHLHIVLFLLLHPRHQVGLQLADVDDVLGMSRGRTWLILRSLSVVLIMPDAHVPPVVENYVEARHTTFVEFLLDLERCKSPRWCIGSEEVHRDAAIAMANFLIRAHRSTATGLRRTITASLSSLLNNVPPDEELISLLQNTDLPASMAVYPFTTLADDGKPNNHQSLWSSPISLSTSFLRRYTYPDSVLRSWEIQLWTGQLCKMLLYRQPLNPASTPSHPSTQYDDAYRAILSHNPRTSFLLRLISHFRRLLPLRAPPETHGDWKIPSIEEAWGFLGDDVDHTALLPLAEMASLGDLGAILLGVQTSPFDFLGDRNRCGDIFVSDAEFAEQLILRWANRMGETRHFTADMMNWVQFGLFNIAYVPPTSLVALQAIQNLDLARTCRDPLTVDRIAHEVMHFKYLKPTEMQHVVDWCERAGPPANAACIFWEEQIAQVRQCTDVSQHLLGPVELDADDADSETYLAKGIRHLPVDWKPVKLLTTV